MRIFFVYEHWRPDRDTCFYVGKGSGNRATTFHRRNRYHKLIQAILADAGMCVEVRLVASSLSEEQAFALEIERIAFWRAAGAKLANAGTGGRGGAAGTKRSAESIAKQSAKTKGRKFSETHLANLRTKANDPAITAKKREAKKGYRHSEETKNKQRAAARAQWEDPEIRAQMLAGMTGRETTEEAKENMRAALTPEVRAKISAAATEQWRKWREARKCES